MAMLSGRLTAILSKHLKPMQISLRAVDYLFVRIGCGQGKLIIGDQKRFYSIQAREGSKEEIVIQSTPYYYRFIPKFFIQKVGFKTRSYDELNSIDFHEKSDLDSYVPYSEFKQLIAENAVLRNELDTHGHLRWLNLTRVHIDRWETNYGLINMKLDWTIINKISDKVDKSKEIRRQRWHHILTKETAHPDVKRLVERLVVEKISVDNFAEDMAEAYDLISDSVKSLVLSAYTKPFVPTEILSVNRSLNILLENLDYSVGKKLNKPEEK